MRSGRQLRQKALPEKGVYSANTVVSLATKLRGIEGSWEAEGKTPLSLEKSNAPVYERHRVQCARMITTAELPEASPMQVLHECTSHLRSCSPLSHQVPVRQGARQGQPFISNCCFWIGTDTCFRRLRSSSHSISPLSLLTRELLTRDYEPVSPRCLSCTLPSSKARSM